MPRWASLQSHSFYEQQNQAGKLSCAPLTGWKLIWPATHSRVVFNTVMVLMMALIQASLRCLGLWCAAQAEVSAASAKAAEGVAASARLQEVEGASDNCLYMRVQQQNMIPHRGHSEAHMDPMQILALARAMGHSLVVRCSAGR